MTKEKAMYQTWLVIEKLPEEERKLIPQDIIEEIEDTMEHDETIVIDSTIPMEKQKLDDKTWNMLEKIIKRIEKAGHKIEKENISDSEKYVEDVKKENEKFSQGDKNFNQSEINEYVQNVKIENNANQIMLENIKLTRQVGELQNQVAKVDEAKVLISDYNSALIEMKKENERLKSENNKIKENCEALINTINRLPKVIKSIFIKEEKVKLLLGK